MKAINYVITDPVGIHARPAGQLVKAVKETGSKVTIEFNGKSADGTKLFAIMGLGVKTGDEIILKIDGGDEEVSALKLEEFLKSNL